VYRPTGGDDKPTAVDRYMFADHRHVRIPHTFCHQQMLRRAVIQVGLPGRVDGDRQTD